MRKVLITGVNGFLGRNLALHLITKDYTVFSLSLHTNNIDDIRGKVGYYYCDLSNKDEVEFIMRHTRPDVVIHCAWSGGNSYVSTNTPVQLGNLTSLETLLTAMDGHHVPFFVGLGAAAEYGDKSEAISEDEYEVPFNLYGACKKMAKDYSRVFCKIRGMRWLWVRPFYTYGPGDVQTRLLPTVVKACKKKEELTLNSCKSYTDYLYIDDFVSGVTTLLDVGATGIYNVCSGNSYLVKDIVGLICQETGHYKITFDPSLDRPGFPAMMVGRNENLKDFGWFPKVSIEEGVKRIVHASK